jgi:hypothetical protein
MSETEHGVAVHIMTAAVEPREAQRPTSLAARTPKAVALGNKVSAVGVLAGREVRPAGCVGLPYRGGDPPWRLPALHPLVSRGKENRDTGPPAARKLSRRAAERWLGACFVSR